MLKFVETVNATATRRRFLSSASGGILAIMLGAFPMVSKAANSDEFFKLVQMDDYRRLPKLLATGLDPNIVESKRGETGLMLAIREDAMRSFNILLNARGINLNARAHNGDTALMVASYKGNVAAVKALLDKEAEPNSTGWTALHYAATIGNDEIVQLLLDASAYIDAGSPNQTTPLMMAAREGKILTVKLLLDSGADETLKNDVGMNAIDFAKKFDHQDIVDGLMSRLKKARQR
ncbi:ankyrin repeat domain-containing protein [Glaciimonas sp. CA11.2]|uniref:ankyrin repeat domain-containing protein n=1 Tax=unclassified Glaciimonas TaxID=2644401 RepID=UPI002AB44EF0|nr:MULTISPECIES: ankyrin repeat domain-containing protein [unclassified Glaciimonas]MDY7547836.1 ankyrin repeat domain-containing protein [Glaciimonas sp. CA11.2]MEB0010010.1 ankyrin repeat domain-containing protein [Glaciimonas sp. Cout2]MEB0081875.1 ankyrin repeat domain-containing protein [Glaciimonas sp. Gout2]MEB0165350.1 ankyrin repeat domain-containing protein [Glaciimonas sp. CA11.2]